MKKVLITGVNGFVGNHAVNEFANNGYEIVGVGGPQRGLVNEKIGTYVAADLTDREAVAQIDFRDISAIVHLAGLAAVGPSFDAPMEYVNTNIGIEVNIFEEALAQGSKPRVLVISSGALYDPSADLPITEQSPVNPSSPYAVSKLGQEQMAQYYGQRGFEVIIARPFNHIGPGQGLGFIVPDLAKQVIDFERGNAKEVLVGNLDAKRDYTDVRDIAKAYRLLIEKGVPGEVYNISSGRALSGHEILERILGAADVAPPISQDQTKLRPSDNPVIYGSYEKITRDTGWKPEVELEKTFSDVVVDWRSKISNN